MCGTKEWFGCSAAPFANSADGRVLGYESETILLRYETEGMNSTLRKTLGLVRDLSDRIQNHGWRQSGRWLVDVVLSLPYRSIEYIVFARPLRERLPTLEPGLPVTLRKATETDLPRFQGLVPPSTLCHFANRLAKGRHCFVALDGARVAAYCWATGHVEFDVDNVDIALQPGDAYLDDSYTVPAYRGQRIQAALRLYTFRYMKELGHERVVAIVAENNTASKAFACKLGYQEIGHLSFRRILWRRTFSLRGLR